MREITVQYIGVGHIGGDGENEAEHAFLLHNYPGPIGEAELYAIKTALEKQVALNAEVQRLRNRLADAVLTAAQ